MQISYCEQWYRAAKRPDNMFTEAQARKAYENGKLHTALIGDPLRPECFLEFTAYRSVGVEFLDSALRTYFDYSFGDRGRPGELFLSRSRRPEFPNEMDPPCRATVLFFKTDGRLATVTYQVNPNGVGSQSVDRQEQIVDVSRNWEPFPKFGDYEGLATADRGTSLLRPPHPPI